MGRACRAHAQLQTIWSRRKRSKEEESEEEEGVTLNEATMAELVDRLADKLRSREDKKGAHLKKVVGG